MAVQNIEAYFGHFQGLSDEEVQERQREYGLNVLPSRKEPSRLAIFLSQFASPLVYVILGAGIVSLILKEYGDFFIIMAVVVFDAMLGFIQEQQAKQTYEGLRKLVKPTATVVRAGVRRDVEVREIVPGDVVILAAGDRVPADGTVLESVKMSVNEAILTGESEPVFKGEDPGRNQLYMGTSVLSGRGIMKVTRTGKDTELGKIAASLSESEERVTPLQARLAAFSRTLTRIVIGVTAALFLIGVAAGKPALEMVRVAIILAIAAIPEGLLIAVTVILVIGMRRILKREGLVKRLLAVETLGSVTTICTDKTGTLTKGLMAVTRTDFRLPERAIQTLVLCNNLEDSLEVALWEFARANGASDMETIVRLAPRVDEEPFSSETKYMRTVNLVEGRRVAFVKGAPEVVAAMCGLPAAHRDEISQVVESWADEGLKVLGLAVKEGDDDALETSGGGYSWAGLVGIEDPIREEVADAVRTCRDAGIQIKIVTGDYERTAIHVARRLGLEVPPGGAVDGQELEAMSDAELASRVREIAVFARISPRQKLRIVAALQGTGEVVAMVGDGVNDAPALKRSDIGVVVGGATDVAKEIADLILLDSNFKTIVAAVEEGRVVFENIKKVVSYTLSNSFAEILLIFGAMIMGWAAPLVVAQILWIHLICDGPVDIVLGFEPAEEGIMREKPKPRSEPILGRLGIGLIAAISITAAAGCLAMFGHYWLVHHDLRLARTLSFATLAVISLVYVFAYRSMRRSIFHTGHLLANRPLLASVAGGFLLAVGAVAVPAIRNVLGIVPLSAGEWLMVFGLAVALLIIVEVGKFLGLARGRRAKPAAPGTAD
ncbi:MAG: HAD-IC family P-type ATPase [Firmicutes bacterium]|jgi:Ca2+-transporting ATPase|nr:HAD-IC family P-type ATPase [Bacillota bacterium]MDH7494574.1 HAD-IC family P-type ATPase [Bacillota bacterium]